MEITLYKSPWRAGKLLLGCAVFVAIGTMMLQRPDAPHAAGWAAVLFFGLGALVSLYQLLDRRPQLILNEVGIYNRHTHHAFINWEIIREAYLVRVHKQHLLCLVVPEEFEPSRQKAGVRKRLLQLSKHMGFQELTIPLGLLALDETRFAEFVRVMAQATQPADRARLLQQYQVA